MSSRWEGRIRRLVESLYAVPSLFTLVIFWQHLKCHHLCIIKARCFKYTTAMTELQIFVRGSAPAGRGGQYGVSWSAKEPTAAADNDQVGIVRILMTLTLNWWPGLPPISDPSMRGWGIRLPRTFLRKCCCLIVLNHISNQLRKFACACPNSFVSIFHPQLCLDWVAGNIPGRSEYLPGRLQPLCLRDDLLQWHKLEDGRHIGHCGSYQCRCLQHWHTHFQVSRKWMEKAKAS